MSKKMKNVLFKKSFILLLCLSLGGLLFFSLARVDGFALEENYDQYDVQKIRAFLDLEFYGQTNGKALSEEYDSSDPASWPGITWQGQSGKRVQEIAWTSWQEVPLHGNLDLSGLSSLEKIELKNTQIASLNLSDCLSLVEIYLFGNKKMKVAFLVNCQNLIKAQLRHCALEAIKLEACVSLKELDIGGNLFSHLDLSAVKGNIEELSCDENKLLEELDLSGFSSLEFLSSDYCSLKNINLTGCTNLKYLNLSYNDLKEVDLSSCADLVSLYCNRNEIESLDLQDCQELEWLNCHNNKLTSLDLRGLTKLYQLDCYDNQLTSLLLEGCVELDFLNCENNSLTALDLTDLVNLELILAHNNQLASVTFANCPNLSQIYINNNQLTDFLFEEALGLYSLKCANNKLESLVIENAPNLHSLECDNNRLTSLNLNSFPGLSYLKCQNNQLTSLEIADLHEMNYLYCYNNQLTSLDIAQLREIRNLYCYNNQLTSLEFSGCYELQNLYCQGNQLTSLQIDSASAFSLDYVDCSDNLLELFTIGGGRTQKEINCSLNRLGFDYMPARGKANTFTYKPQREIIFTPNNCWPISEEIDLSHHARDGMIYSNFNWFTSQGEEIFPRKISDGIYIFEDQEHLNEWIYANITRVTYPDLVLQTRPFLLVGDASELEIVSQPEDILALRGELLIFKVFALDPNAELLHYQWESSPDQGQNWQELAGEKSFELKMTFADYEAEGYLYRCKVSNGLGDELYSNHASLHFLKDPIIVRDITDRVFLEGDDFSFSIEAEKIDGDSNSSLHYSWYYKFSDASNWNELEDSDQAEIDLGPVLADNNGVRIKCQIYNKIDDLESNHIASTSALCTVVLEASLEEELQDQIVAQGQDARMSVSASPSENSNLICCWERSLDDGSTWQTIEGETGPDLDFKEVTFQQNHSLYRVSFASTKEGLTSGYIAGGQGELFVVALPEITQDLSPKIALAGDKVPLEILAQSADEDEGGVLSYQWQNQLAGSWLDIYQANAACYEIENVTFKEHNQNLYRCLLTNTKLGVSIQTISSPALLTVLEQAEIIEEPQDKTAAIGSTVEFTAKIQASLGAELLCQWQVSEDEGESWQGLPQAQENTLLLENVKTDMEANLYRLKAWSSLDEVKSEEAISRAARLSIVADPQIIEEAKDLKIPVGTKASFEIKVKDIADGKGALSYQWQKLEDEKWTDILEATNSSYTIEEVSQENHNSKFRAKVINTRNEVSSNVILSKEVQLEVLAWPSITQGPQDLTLAKGGEACFSLEVSTGHDFTLAYQWQKYSTDKWEDIEGANTSEYSFAVLDYALEGSQYRALVEVSYGDEILEILTSKSAQLMLVLDPEIITQPTDVSVKIGTPASFSIVLKELEADKGLLSYQWQRLVDEEWSDIENAKGSSYSIEEVQLTDHNSQYRCQLLNIRNDLPSNLVTSQNASLTVELGLEVKILRPQEGSDADNPLNISTGSLVIIELEGELENVAALTMKINEEEELELKPAHKIYYLLGNNMEAGENTISLQLIDVLGQEQTVSVDFYWEIYRRGFGFGRISFPE